MTRSSIVPLPTFFDRYIQLVPAEDLFAAFEHSVQAFDHYPWAQLAELGDYRYAPSKWTIADIFQHLIDTERIMAYRALRFARLDPTPLPGFDEDHFAAHAAAERRTLEELRAELLLLRQGTLALFRSFPATAAQRAGTASGNLITVAGLGFVIVGHEAHHWQIIRERYLPPGA